MKRKLTALLLSILFIPSTQPVFAGWSQCWRYTENGAVVRSCWRQLNGDWYYFDADGIMKTGWIYTGGKWYYCDAGGRMAIGWLTLDDGVYYLTNSGAMVDSCTMTIDGKRYRFTSSGRTIPLDSSELFSEKFTALSFDGKLTVLKELFPAGSYWNCTADTERLNFVSVTGTPCSHGMTLEEYDRSRCHVYNGKTAEFLGVSECIQCLGFASMVSDFLFGPDSGVEAFLDYSSLKPGDHVRLTKDQHSFIVLEKTDTYVTVLECNGDYQTCRIRWGRQIAASALKRGEVIFLRRTDN